MVVVFVRVLDPPMAAVAGALDRGPEVLLGLLIGLLVALTTTRPPVLDEDFYEPRTRALARVLMTSLVIAAGIFVWFAIRRGLGVHRLGTPDSQYVATASALLGLYACALHYEPLLRPLVLSPRAALERSRMIAVAVSGPALIGGGFALLAIWGGHGRHIFEHARFTIDLLLPALASLALGGIVASRYVAAFPPRTDKSRSQA
jgi:hypothetical protein